MEVDVAENEEGDYVVSMGVTQGSGVAAEETPAELATATEGLTVQDE